MICILILKAFSVAPLMVYPVRYTGEAGYISDTESSEIVPDTLKNADSKPDKGAKEVDVDKTTVLPATVAAAKGDSQSAADATAAAAAAASQIEDIGNIGKEEFQHSEL